MTSRTELTMDLDTIKTVIALYDKIVDDLDGKRVGEDACKHIRTLGMYLQPYKDEIECRRL